jgi:hypothetical protein
VPAPSRSGPISQHSTDRIVTRTGGAADFLFSGPVQKELHERHPTVSLRPSQDCCRLIATEGVHRVFLIKLSVFLTVVLGSLEPPVCHSVTSGNPEPALRRLEAYASLRRNTAGCTAVLRRYSDGTVSFVGCPTYSCDQDTCDPEAGAQIVWCACEKVGDDRYLCLSVVVFDQAGSVLGWECIQQQCAGDCADNPAPVVGPGDPPVDFYACDCES